MTDRLVEYLESLIEVAARGNAATAESHAADIEKIFAAKRPKRTIYIVTENDRYGEETWDLGLPSDIEIEWEQFDFNTRDGDLDVDEVRDQIERLKKLETLSGRDLSDKIKERLEWLDDRLEEERNQKQYNEAARASALEQARKVLREAGELPEVPDGNDTADG